VRQLPEWCPYDPVTSTRMLTSQQHSSTAVADHASLPGRSKNCLPGGGVDGQPGPTHSALPDYVADIESQA